MKHLFLALLLRRLEWVGNNDLLLIQALGPALFDTPDLKHALRELKEQEKRYRELDRRLFQIAIYSLLSLTLGFLAHRVGASFWSSFLVLLFPALLALFIAGKIYLHWQHPVAPYFVSLRKSIAQELFFREKDASIF